MRLITLSTDFGISDYYVALLKGHILKQNLDAQIIDITHSITPFDIMEGAFFLKSSYRPFPKGTIHVILVNTFYAAQNKLVLFEKNGFFFLGPNNGIFSLVFDTHDSKGIIEINLGPKDDLYQTISRAIYLLKQGANFSLIGDPIPQYDIKLTLQAVVSSDYIRATIIHVDQFGNVIVNLSRTAFYHVCKDRIYAIYYKSSEPLTKLSARYSDVANGDVCAFFNDIDLLEIGINMGNAHQLLNLNKNETIQIDFHDVPI